MIKLNQNVTVLSYELFNQNVKSKSEYISLLFSRQVQRLCDFKGAECEEYDHHSPRRPAMLGTRLHVVSSKYPNLCYVLLSVTGKFH